MDRKRNRAFVLISILVVLTAVITLASLVVVRLLTGRAAHTAASPGEQYLRHYAFIHTGSDDGLWDKIYSGALGRANELDAYVEDFGASLTVDYDRDALIGIAIDAAVDGIIVDGDSSEETTRMIDLAQEAGIPVVTVFNDSAESDRVCFVGFSNYSIGRQYGAELLDDNPSEAVRICVVMDNDSGAGGQNLVISGIYDEFADRGLGDNCNIEGVYVNNETTFTAEEDIRDIFIGSNLPDAIVALNSVYTRCLFQAAVDYNKTGNVALYGFDDSDDILEALGKELLEATISVDASKMGASAVEALDEYINTGHVTNYIAQDTEVIRGLEARTILALEEQEEGT